MEDSIIIWKYLSRILKDDSIHIYAYCTNNKHIDSKGIIETIVSEIKIIFSPPLELSYLKTVIKAFLDMKKKQYQNGQIKIKSFY